jgi:hypothetical protein
VISLFSLIYRSPRFADALVASLMENTPELHNGQAEFYFVANRAEPRLKAHLSKAGYRYIEINPPVLTDDELRERGYDPPEYLHGVYCALNEGIRAARELVCVLSSDHVFTPGWLTALRGRWTPGVALSSLTIEPGGPFGVFPITFNGTGAWQGDFGRDPEAIDREGLLRHAALVACDRLSPGGAHQPTLVERDACMEAGLYPEGNPTGDYGDRAFFRRLEGIGVRHMTTHGSVVYHIGEGEMRQE